MFSSAYVRAVWLLLMIALPIVSYGQDIQVSIVSNRPGNDTLYTGKANLVEIKNLPDRATISMKYGRIRNLRPGQAFIFEPYRNIPQTDTLIIKQGRVLIMKRGFPVLFSECAYFQLGTIVSDTIQGAVVKEPPRPSTPYPGIRCPLLFREFSPGFHIDTAAIIGSRHPIAITQFSISIEYKGRDLIGPMLVTGNRLSASDRGQIINAYPGAIIEISNVKWECGGCHTFIHPFSLTQRIVVK